MTKDEVVKMMVESMNDDNRAICENNGMDPAKIAEQIDQSQQALYFMMNNVYDKMKAKDLLAL